MFYSDGRGALSYRERRREAHTAAEQKRRDAIKKVCRVQTYISLVSKCLFSDPDPKLCHHKKVYFHFLLLIYMFILVLQAASIGNGTTDGPG
jgi:hypothetical protein